MLTFLKGIFEIEIFVHQFGPLIRFMADKEFASTIHMLEALPFAPPNDVIDLFDTLADCIK